MNTHAEDAVDRYFSGGMQASQRDALFGHLDRCAECKQYFDDIAYAHRMISGEDATVSDFELALIGRFLVDEKRHRAPKPFAFLRDLVGGEKPQHSPSGVVRWLFAGALPLFGAAFSFWFFAAPNPHNEWAARGSKDRRTPVVEVLCFDQEAQVTQHLTESGSCPAPGFVKVLYASPQTVPNLVVAAVAEKEIRFALRLERPEPRSVIPQHAELKVGEALRIVVLEEDQVVHKHITQDHGHIVVQGVLP